MAGLEAAAKERVAAHGRSLEVFAAAERLEVDVCGNRRAVAVPNVSAIRRPPVAGKRVLVVSSSETDIATIGQLLAEDNLVLLPTSDKRTALSCAPDILPDLAIIDGQLPDGDGAELIEPLRARLGWPDFPIILLTERPDAAGDLRITETTGTDCLPKPFSAPMLRTRVLAWLTRTIVANGSHPSGKVGRGATSLRSAEDARAADNQGAADVAAAAHADALAMMPLFRSLDRQQIGRAHV